VQDCLTVFCPADKMLLRPRVVCTVTVESADQFADAQHKKTSNWTTRMGRDDDRRHEILTGADDRTSDILKVWSVSALPPALHIDPLKIWSILSKTERAHRHAS